VDITREQFEEQRHPRFGTANPERMAVPFWEWMIRGDDRPSPDEGCVLGKFGLMMRNGVLKSGYGPYRARDLFDALPSKVQGPIWTFDRMGQTRTELADGRLVCVAGEHEDYYDPDFHIYNDVVVFAPDGGIEIFGYPRDVFPPTDFHTATPDGERLVLVGCIGYPADRVPDHTPVYSLDLATYRIDRLDTTGQMPGWIGRHDADLDPARRVLTVRGGEVLAVREDKQRFRRNVEEYELDLGTLAWRRTTDRNWPQYAIRRADGKWFVLDDRPDFEAFRPAGVPHEVLPPADWNTHRLAVGGVMVRFAIGVGEVEILVEGALAGGLADDLVEAARLHVEAAIGRECVVDAC
jgi:hypothetical protein